MIVNLKEKDDLPFEWIDISNPARRELREVAEKYRLHRALVEDSLQPEHFSVFFMPLTFIVGIYGMNFKYMPELSWPAGYPLLMLVMAAVTVVIYGWFKWKGWL